jgi:hypothetical protein
MGRVMTTVVSGELQRYPDVCDVTFQISWMTMNNLLLISPSLPVAAKARRLETKIGYLPEKSRIS